jgi:hypothetical protein
MVSVANTGGLCDEITPRQAYFALGQEFLGIPVPASSKGSAIALAVLLSSAGALAALRRARRDPPSEPGDTRPNPRAKCGSKPPLSRKKAGPPP